MQRSSDRAGLRFDESIRVERTDGPFHMIDGNAGELVVLDIVEHRPAFFFDDGQSQSFSVLGHIVFVASHEQERILEENLQSGQRVRF